jgi:hypothetical protein
VLHGGYSDAQGSALITRLLREVHLLYNKDRSRLSLADRQLFHLPKSYRLKQGNQQLLLWTKQAHLTFDIYDENIDGPQQTYITDWLQSWQPPLDCLTNSNTIVARLNDNISSAHSDSRFSSLPIIVASKETNTLQCNNLNSVKDTDGDSDSLSSQEQETHLQINKKVIKRKYKVADGTSQYITPVMSSFPLTAAQISLNFGGDEHDCGICYLRNRS